jgi:hypothetical protein
MEGAKHKIGQSHTLGEGDRATPPRMVSALPNAADASPAVGMLIRLTESLVMSNCTSTSGNYFAAGC